MGVEGVVGVEGWEGCDDSNDVEFEPGIVVSGDGIGLADVEIVVDNNVWLLLFPLLLPLILLLFLPLLLLMSFI